ncbi:MAG: PH domain-containing protein [Longimicrobiales bacterium]
MSIRSALLDLLRVPHEPSAPEGDEQVQIFRAAPNFFWYRVVKWLIKNAFGLLGLWSAVAFAAVAVPRILPGQISLGFITLSRDTLLLLFHLLEAGAIAGFIGQAVASFLLIRLDFEQRWYIVSDRSLRIREGLVRMSEQTVTFANVQNVSIRQGPIQRLLGIADLQVRTAGGKGGQSDFEEGKPDLHVAHFRGIAHPEMVRNTMRERLRQHRDAGLGDPDDAPAPDLLSAALEFAAEAKLVRAAATRDG